MIIPVLFRKENMILVALDCFISVYKMFFPDLGDERFIIEKHELM